MFNKDFFPTPLSVLQSMGIHCLDKIVLEPSAGKGDIIDYLRDNGAKEILACEINPDLSKIVAAKADRFLRDDFLKVGAEDVSHVQLMVMNPPFSADEKHILHAWHIAPGGCEIIALCNFQTYDNPKTRKRKELAAVIDTFGTCENLGEVFTEAERTTRVQVGLITLRKPEGDAKADEFAGFFMGDVPEDTPGGYGIMRHNVVREIVQRYVHSVKAFDEFDAVAERMNSLTDPFNIGNFKFNVQRSRTYYDAEVLSKDKFRVELQKKAWQYLFNMMNMDKYVTAGVKEKINKFAEQQSKVPFTERNIYRMLEIIVGTSEQNFNEALVSVVDRFTQHTHENRFGVEGWKTNAGHLLNKKFIAGNLVEVRWGGPYLSFGYGMYSNSHKERLQDLVKVLCHITGTSFDTVESFDMFFHRNNIEPGKWYENGFFRFKGFLKGTLHLEFRDENDWAMLNQRYAKIKGVTLPEKTWQRPKKEKKSKQAA